VSNAIQGITVQVPGAEQFLFASSTTNITNCLDRLQGLWAEKVSFGKGCSEKKDSRAQCCRRITGIILTVSARLLLRAKM
jgi:hypothetical protein